MGASFLLLVRLQASESLGRLRWVATAVVIGLGPLVRPDLAMFSVGFLVALGVCFTAARGRTGAMVGAVGWCGLLGAAALTPFAYQLFRMGYFAALVPNTALAKEAGAAWWSQGWRYAIDFVGTYALWIPLAALLGWWAARLGRRWRCHDAAARVLLITPVLSAAAHAVYVVRVGGDFMHGRFLLPALFGALLPVATVIVPGRRTSRAAWFAGLVVAGVVVGWAVTCALWLRVPYAGAVGPAGIADERGFFVGQSGRANPVTPEDYAAFRWAVEGLALRARAERQRLGLTWSRPLLVGNREFPLALAVDTRVAVVAVKNNLGLVGYLAGLRVHVIEGHGLNDPIASRLRLTERRRPGHEKSLPVAWTIARFGDPAMAMGPDVVAAREALACGDLGELRRAVEGRLTVRRFLDNVRLAWRLHRLRIPPDPEQAGAELCDARPAVTERPRWTAWRSPAGVHERAATGEARDQTSPRRRRGRPAHPC